MPNSVRILTTFELINFIYNKVDDCKVTSLVETLIESDEDFLLTCYGVVTNHGKNYIRSEAELINEINLLAETKFKINKKRKGESL